MSPSSRGRGLKYRSPSLELYSGSVALFTRAWIEIDCMLRCHVLAEVALFTRAWIEIDSIGRYDFLKEVALFTRAWIEINGAYKAAQRIKVALFTRAWIEITLSMLKAEASTGRPLHEGVD